MKDLELIRKYVSAENLKNEYRLEYSLDTIKSVLFGRRTNNKILHLACTLALKTMYTDSVQLKKIEFELSAGETTSFNSEFQNMTVSEKVEFIIKHELKEIQELKKDLIKKGIFEYSIKELPKGIQSYLEKPNRKFLKLIRVTYGSMKYLPSFGKNGKNPLE